MRPLRRRFRLLPLFLLGLSASSLLVTLYAWNQAYIDQELEAPLDHALPMLLRSFYSCPVIPSSETPVSADVPFLMISARPRDQVQPILDTWNNDNTFRVQLVSTHNVSQSYRNTHCQHETFKARLFAVYQHVFRQALHDFPGRDYFVTIEDDVKLLDATSLAAELKWAVAEGVDYFSFYKNGPSCFYRFGTVAQVLSANLMRQIVEAEPECRLPIDMYIAQRGPFFVTQRPLVQHVGKRLHRVGGQR